MISKNIRTSIETMLPSASNIFPSERHIQLVEYGKCSFHLCNKADLCMNIDGKQKEDKAFSAGLAVDITMLCFQANISNAARF